MTVNALKKKYGDSDVGALSRDLVIKWKAVVAREDQEREQEEAEAENDDEEDQQGHSEPEYHPTPRRHPQIFTNLPQFHSHHARQR